MKSNSREPLALSKKIKTRASKLERGQSLVELGLSLVVMLMLLTGAVEFGLALFQYVTMRDAAQEGALYGSINPVEADDTTLPYSANAQELRNRVIAAANDIVQLDMEDDIEVTINGNDCEGLTSGVPHSITVTVTFAHPITMPLVTPIIGSDTINLTAEVTDTILTPTC
jgi:Flp pilus assembly protein TadG